MDKLETQVEDELGLGMKLEDIPVVFDCKTLAKIIGCSIGTARTIMNRPGFPVWRITNKKHRIYRAKFLEWLEQEVAKTS